MGGGALKGIWGDEGGIFARVARRVALVSGMPAGMIN